MNSDYLNCILSAMPNSPFTNSIAFHTLHVIYTFMGHQSYCKSWPYTAPDNVLGNEADH